MWPSDSLIDWSRRLGGWALFAVLLCSAGPRMAVASAAGAGCEIPTHVVESAGLDALSAEEFEIIENWARARCEALKLQARAARQEFKRATTPEEIRSYIPGEFEGWDGDSRFELANGQVWKQRQHDIYYMPLTEPEVVIRRGPFGYRMEILETGRKVAVRRIE